MNAIEVSDCLRLMDQARAGSRPDLGQLLERYRGLLTRLARSRLRPQMQAKADPSDLVQETFLEAHRHFDQFRGTSEAELAGWLRRILASRLAKLVKRFWGTRRRDLRREHTPGADADQSSGLLNRGLVAPQSSPSQRVSRREQNVLLTNALARLPDDYREVLVLHHLEGCTFPEVARRMGRSLDSVKHLWARALARLRRVLGGTS